MPSSPSNAYDSEFNRSRSALVARGDVTANKNPLTKTKGIVSNAGIPTEAYFRNYASNNTVRDGLWSVLRTDIPSNYPPSLDKREDLWSPGAAHKGVFLKYRAPGTFNLDDNVAANASPEQILESNIYYGFQFHYNPTSIAMTYGGIPEVDISLYTSGTEAFNALGTGVSKSTITFNMIINRVFDMKYYDAKTQMIKTSVKKGDFAGRYPTEEEQKEIYNKGTMYDIEFFLRTIMGGVTMSSYLGRNAWDGKTSDMGFLTGIPVELHLGKSMRYLGRVEGFSVNHVLFTERMVPTFSEVSVTLTRIPDHGLNTMANPNGSSAAPPVSTANKINNKVNVSDNVKKKFNQVTNYKPYPQASNFTPYPQASKFTKWKAN